MIGSWPVLIVSRLIKRVRSYDLFIKEACVVKIIGSVRLLHQKWPKVGREAIKKCNKKKKKRKLWCFIFIFHRFYFSDTSNISQTLNFLAIIWCKQYEKKSCLFKSFSTFYSKVGSRICLKLMPSIILFHCSILKHSKMF